MELFYEAEQMKKKRFIFINLIAVWYETKKAIPKDGWFNKNY